ncbi:MAG: alpha/beta hydrolase [Archangium sp.]|nr:alpha/beta hydrolase [Archangium sp.]
MTRLLLSFIAFTACGTTLTPTLAQVSGRTVEVVEAGSGSATVVFEAGLGTDWVTWDPVAHDVSAHARVFGYSRPGYGRSQTTAEPPTATRIVEDLRALLAARAFTPPYILVGHSFGGAYLELFAKTHPDEVVGLVLVDSRPAGFGAACVDAGISGCSISTSAAAALPAHERAEVEAFPGVADELRAAGSFGPYPVRVLVATSHSLSREGEALWVAMQRATAAEAADGQAEVFTGVGHNLHRERPRDVVKVILALIPVPAT